MQIHLVLISYASLLEVVVKLQEWREIRRASVAHALHQVLEGNE